MAHNLACAKLVLKSSGGGGDLIRSVDKSRRDALHFAVDSFPSGSENTELVELLLSSGAKISSGAALLAAVSKGSLALTQVIVTIVSPPKCLFF